MTVSSLQPAYGGPARSVSRTAHALEAAGLQVGVWAADQSAPTTPFLSGAPGVIRLSGSPEHAVDTFGGADILHDNGIWPLYHHRLAALATARRIPRIVSTRGMLEPWAIHHKTLKKRAAWWLYQRRDLARADCHHTTASREAEHLERLALGVPVRVIPNGIDVPSGAANPNPADLKTALFLGRLYPVKGLPSLLEAWMRLRPRGWRLQIAGPDEAGHRASLEQLVRNAGLGDVVTFSGPLDDDARRAAFFGADLFVLPSHSESFGMAVAEALAHGLPVLTTTGAPWPMLRERGCGWQVPPTVEGLVGGLEQATSLPVSALRGMGREGRAFVASAFQWPRVAAAFVGLYQELRDRR